MTPQELKNSILQLAIQGKLVEQRAEEGTAAELLEKIARNGTHKTTGTTRTKSRAAHRASSVPSVSSVPDVPPIPDDEKPFDIPESWEWVRLGEVLRVIGGVSYDKKDVAKTGFRILRGGNIQNMKVILAEDDVFLPAQYEDDDKLVRVGDILIVASTGSKAVIGKGGYVDRVLHNTMIGAFLRICRPSSFELADYLRIIFESDFYRKHIRVLAQGTNINNVKESYITQFAIPLPPLAEQKRIVAKIEELLPLIDRYEKAWSKLEDFNKRFPGDMQKSLLQMAIQGKLVKQRPEEGTAAELVGKILAAKNAKGAKKYSRAEPQRRREQSDKSSVPGHVRPDCPGSPVSPADTPFDIPESWVWARLGEVFNIVNGFTPLKSNPEYWTNGDVPWFTIEDVHRQGRIIKSTEKFITRKALSKGSDRIVPADTVLLCCTASVGEYAYTKIPLTTNQQFNAFVLKNDFKKFIDPMYVFEYAKTLKGQLIDQAGKTTFNFVSVGKLTNLPIPLPPLAEQKRIVAKLEELLPLCEWLK